MKMKVKMKVKMKTKMKMEVEMMAKMEEKKMEKVKKVNEKAKNETMKMTQASSPSLPSFAHASSLSDVERTNGEDHSLPHPPSGPLLLFLPARNKRSEVADNEYRGIEGF